MSDTMFKCKFCEQSLEAPADMAGELIDCPQCQKTIEVPFPHPSGDTHKRPAPNVSAHQRSFTKTSGQPAKKGLRRYGIIVGVAIAILMGLVISSVIFLSPKSEGTRVSKATSSQAEKELSARLIHKANYDELKAKWDQINSLQQVGIGDSAELAKAADTLERAMVIEFQKADPPDWITEQQSAGVFEENGGWSQYEFVTSNEELTALMFKRVNETATQAARNISREFSE